MVDLARMEAQLVLHEGLRTEEYLDTEGNRTVGVGYNISGRGLEFLEDVLERKVSSPVTVTAAEALLVLRADIERVQRAVSTYFPEYAALSEVRQRVCVDMAFNMGFSALKFKHAIEAIKARDWSRAARELYRSKWAEQVGDGEGGKLDRADRLARMLLTGVDYVA